MDAHTTHKVKTFQKISFITFIILLLGISVTLLYSNSKNHYSLRNTQRQQDIETILNATYSHIITVNGVVPTSIPTVATCATPATNEICKTGATDCAGLVDLGAVTTDQKYLVSIPSDPTGASTNGTGYFISKSANGRITVCAPSAEQGASIQVIR